MFRRRNRRISRNPRGCRSSGLLTHAGVPRIIFPGTVHSKRYENSVPAVVSETARAGAGANRAQYAAALANAVLAGARVKSAAAALDLARLQLSYTTVKAPASGLLSRLSARTGQIVQLGQVVGELARIQGARVPARLITSAKSWLAHGGVEDWALAVLVTQCQGAPIAISLYFCIPFNGFNLRDIR